METGGDSFRILSDFPPFQMQNGSSKHPEVEDSLGSFGILSGSAFQDPSSNRPARSRGILHRLLVRRILQALGSVY